MTDTTNTTTEQKTDTKPKKMPEFNQEELLTIFDKILFEGEYSEQVVIKGKLKVIFRSRTTEETLKISREMDGIMFNLISSSQEWRAARNLAYSLVSYSGNDLSRLALEEKQKFIDSLPISITAALANALSKFDRKVDAACREAEENF